MYAFENTWHVVGLITGLVIVRATVPHVSSLRSYRAALLELLDSFLIAVLLVFCILRPFVIQAFYIPSGSMEPTLVENDRILVSKFIYYFKQPKVGDIVVFDAPPQALDGQPKKDFIKRVVGTPGDAIAVKNQSLYRNGVAVQEPYINGEPEYTWPDDAYEGGECVVPPGHVLVFGDNRNDSNDGHRWDTVGPDGMRRAEPFLPRPNVLGKAMIIFWPLNRIRLLR